MKKTPPLYPFLVSSLEQIHLNLESVKYYRDLRVRERKEELG
jgi:hypothetical protein